MDFQIVLNTYAIDTFRKQADCDYIAARANYRMRLRQQFLWSAQQAVEKYLKAILLFHGLSSHSYQKSKANGSLGKQQFIHDLFALYDEVSKISCLSIQLNQEDWKFLCYLSHQGGSNRYLSTTGYNLAESLDQLDSLVWNIRRYCQSLPSCRTCAMSIRIRQLTIESIQKADQNLSHLFSITGGELEKILKEHPRDKARQSLIWKNRFFGSKKKISISYIGFSSSEIPPHERGWSGVDWDEVKKFVKI